jgi:hypothetical protein
MYLQTGKNKNWTHMQVWTSKCMHKYRHKRIHSMWIR